MFSLVISLIAIAVGVALLLAALFYGGSTLSEGTAHANAVGAFNQGEQILSAAQLYHSDRGIWPADLQTLVDAQYLATIPAASVDGPPVTWTSVQTNVPFYWLPQKVPQAQCQHINLIARGDDGIFNAAKPSLRTQCFGQDAHYTAIVGWGDDSPVAMAAMLTVAAPDLLVDESGGGFSVVPSVTPKDNGLYVALGPFNVPGKIVGDSSFVLVAPQSASPGNFVFSSDAPNVVSIRRNVATIVGPGTANITVTQAASPPYAIATTSSIATVTAAPLITPAVGAFSVPLSYKGDAPFALVPPTSDSQGAFSFSSDNPMVLSVANGMATVVGAGSATITATQSPMGAYGAGSQTATATVLAVRAGPPTLGTFSVSYHYVGDAPFALTPPTSNSTGAFTYVSDNPSVISINNSTATVGALGTANITATQAADGTFASGSRSTVAYVVKKNNLGPFGLPPSYPGNAAFKITPPTSSSPGAFSYTSSNPGVLSVNGDMVTPVAAGTTTITATQAAAGSYGSASVTAVAQVKTATSPTYGGYTLFAMAYFDAPKSFTPPTSNSGGAWTWTSSNPAILTVSGTSITPVSPGVAYVNGVQAAYGSMAAGTYQYPIHIEQGRWMFTNGTSGWYSANSYCVSNGYRLPSVAELKFKNAYGGQYQGGWNWTNESPAFNTHKIVNMNYGNTPTTSDYDANGYSYMCFKPSP